MDSFLLQKQVRDNASDLQEFCKDLQEWGNEMKKIDESLKRSSNNQSEVPSQKNKVRKVTESNKQVLVEDKPIKKTKNKSCDYAAWDKFDADAYCTKMDKEEAGENSSPESELSDEIDNSAIDLANSEKGKGNAFVKKQQWDQAIECYTRSIEYYAYDPIYYANRALCYLKKEKYKNAESDCTTALQLDKTYVKAYQRRAAARENLNQITEAHSDLLKVLELEPKNKESKNVLLRIEKKLEGIKEEKPTDTTDEPRPVSKFTLSRQKQKNSKVEIQDTKADGIKKEVPAFGEHVVERILPSSSGITSEIEPLLSDNNKHIVKETNSKTEVKEEIKPLDDSLLRRHDKDSIQLFQSIHKAPRLRSKKPLKRVQIIDVDLETEKLYLSNNKLEGVTENKDKGSCEKKNNENEASKKNDVILLAPQITQSIETDKKDENLETKRNVNALQDLNLPVPKTSVQFYNSWKTINSKQLRKNYLLKVNPNNFKSIFRESLESKTFSDIIEILNENCGDITLDLYSYLMGLTEVKRFGALIMFMSLIDKKNLLSIIDHLKQDNRYSTADIDNLVKLYEL